MPQGLLLWDEENEEHVLRHNLDPEEVEQAFYSSSSIIRQSRDSTYRVIGGSNGGRYLTIIVAPRPGGNWCVVTARDPSLLERRTYRGR
jgi:uncharacterized DUF497 family protein